MSRPPLTSKPLAAILGKTLNEVFAKQGFASRELVTRWAEIAGQEVAAHSEPLKIQWPRPVEGEILEPATLVLRVEGPMALEIQHASDAIIARLNRFFGWQAIGRIAFRQAPLSRPVVRRPHFKPDPATIAEIATTLETVTDDGLKQALARLGASLKHS